MRWHKVLPFFQNRTKYSSIFVLCFIFSVTLSAQLNFPIKSGRIVFHTYSDWTNWDGKLFMFDFANRKLIEISKNWTSVDHPVNAHFSPDGSKIVFMAVPKGMHTSSSWNVYLFPINSTDEPVNLTPNTYLDQDPKFFRDGVHICYKSNGDLKVMNIETKEIVQVTHDGWGVEESMPYPTTDGKKIIYSTGAGNNTFIYSVNLDGTENKIIDGTLNVHSYYPIVRDDSIYIFTRGTSASNAADDLFLANLNTGKSVSLPFNISTADDSDPYPVDSEYVFFSSNRTGVKGGWDLFLGNSKTGASWTLSLFGLNSTLHELGVCYTPFGSPVKIGMEEEIPSSFRVSQNYPNPFNPTTSVAITLDKKSDVTLNLYDAIGRLVKTVYAGNLDAGTHTLNINAADLPAGVFFYQVSTETQSLTMKCILLK